MYLIDPCHFRFLSDLERWDARDPSFPAALRIHARTAWPTAIKFGVLTPRGEHNVSGGQPCIHPKVAGPAHPNLGPIRTPIPFDLELPN